MRVSLTATVFKWKLCAAMRQNCDAFACASQFHKKLTSTTKVCYMWLGDDTVQQLGARQVDVLRALLPLQVCSCLASALKL